MDSAVASVETYLRADYRPATDLDFLTGLELTAPQGYIDEVWNLAALSGVRLGFMPLEELLFAFGFGTDWSGVYEHFKWRRPLGGWRPVWRRCVASNGGGRTVSHTGRRGPPYRPELRRRAMVASRAVAREEEHERAA